jgi:hypothetical protein
LSADTRKRSVEVVPLSGHNPNLEKESFMERIKKYLLVSLGFALAGMIGAAFGTGTAQAVVATLVEVVNPTTSPVQTNPVNVTDPGRIAYQSTIVNTCLGDSSCVFNFPAVPAGHRVVVQHIVGFADESSSTTSFVPDNSPVLVEVDAHVTNPFSFIFFSTPISGKFGLNEAVQLYVDGPSSSPSLTVIMNPTAGLIYSGGAQVTLTGYEVDCTVAACAPIATQ